MISLDFNTDLEITTTALCPICIGQGTVKSRGNTKLVCNNCNGRCYVEVLNITPLSSSLNRNFFTIQRNMDFTQPVWVGGNYWPLHTLFPGITYTPLENPFQPYFYTDKVWSSVLN